MSLPAKGTTERAILDYVSSARSRSPNGISRAISNVNKRTVLRLIAALKTDEMLREDATGSVALTAKTKALYREQERVGIAEYKPMTAISVKNIPSIYGMRAGSNDYLAWPSKFA